MRPRLVLVALVLAAWLAGAVSVGAHAADSPYVPVSGTERKQTRPLVDLVLLARRRGEFWRLCDIMSQGWVEQSAGTRARCRSEARRQPAAPCRSCSYRTARVVGVYRSASDRRQKRKTIVWLIAIEGDARFRGESGLELRFRREHGRWALTDMLMDGLPR